MPSRSHPTAQKRAKERARAEKAHAKAQRRAERKQDKTNRPGDGPAFEIGEPQDALFIDDEEAQP
jgi:hypothetical protein